MSFVKNLFHFVYSVSVDDQGNCNFLGWSAGASKINNASSLGFISKKKQIRPAKLSQNIRLGHVLCIFGSTDDYDN